MDEARKVLSDASKRNGRDIEPDKIGTNSTQQRRLSKTALFLLKLLDLKKVFFKKHTMFHKPYQMYWTGLGRFEPASSNKKLRTKD